MIDADNPVSGDSTPDDDTEVSLSEAAQAVMDVLVERKPGGRAPPPERG